MHFSEFGLHPKTLKAIEDTGYVTPTPIQQEAIPLVLHGLDVVGCAQTGTGKTASFTLPMIERLLTGRRRARMPRALVLTPTREIAMQVEDNFKKYSKYHELECALLVGGMSPVNQQKLLTKGVDVLIATPGRLLEQVEKGNVVLLDVSIFIIDEADRMLDMGFIPDIERIAAQLPAKRQTLMFSATMPDAIRKLAGKFLRMPQEVSITPTMMTADRVEQFACRVPAEFKDKQAALLQIITERNLTRAIIFCNRKVNVTALCKAMKKQGIDVAELHGDMMQGERMGTLEKFKADKIAFLVASDVAARGLHVDALPTVINFDVPNQPDDYVHRIGRTGRAGESGQSYTLVSPADAKAFAALEAHTGKPLTWLEGGVAPVSPAVPARRTPAHKSTAKPVPAPKKAQALSKQPTPELQINSGFGDDLPAFLRQSIG